MTLYSPHTRVLKASLMDDSQTNDSFEMNRLKESDKIGSQEQTTTDTINNDFILGSGDREFINE